MHRDPKLVSLNNKPVLNDGFGPWCVSRGVKKVPTKVFGNIYLSQNSPVKVFQLSGGETWRYCQEIKGPVIKVMHISVDKKVEQILTEIEVGYQLRVKHDLICLLDSKVRGAYGGTGEAFGWQLARQVSAKFPVIIAGGLNPANVGRLVKEAKPWGVDVSTGVEVNGQKDTAKIRAFIEAVRKAEEEVSQLSQT